MGLALLAIGLENRIPNSSSQPRSPTGTDLSRLLILVAVAHAALSFFEMGNAEVFAVADEVDARLRRSVWDTAALHDQPGEEVAAAAEVAVFALQLAGKKRQARRGGRFGQLIVRFALAACVALASVAAACDKPDANPEATQVAISELPRISASSAAITAPARASPAQFTDLRLLDPGNDSQPWALAVASDVSVPVLVDRSGSGLESAGSVYRLAAQPVQVGSRDGPSQFLDPLQAATQTGSASLNGGAGSTQLVQKWAEDERYLAATRAIAGQPTVLDAAYNAPAAAAAGGTHTYLNGVVLRVEPDKPVVEVIDRALLESGRPTRAEDVVFVAVRDGERSLYEPGQVVNLRDVVMESQNTDVDGQQTTIYVANAALQGARVEPTGRVDLQALLQPRLQRVDQDVAAQNIPAAPGSTPTLGATLSSVQPVIVQQRSSGPSLIDDFLIWMWLSNTGFFRGPSVIINNPPPLTYGGGAAGGYYYSAPPPPSGSTPSTVSSSQTAARSTALEASRSAVSGQASGTGGGVAATNKSAADASARVSAATSKSASIASSVSAASVGKSVSSAAATSGSTTASRSAGSTSAGTRGSAGRSSSGGSSSGGGKGISGSGGGFGGKGASSGGSA